MFGRLLVVDRVLVFTWLPNVEIARFESDHNLVPPRPDAMVRRPAGKPAGLSVNLDCALSGKHRDCAQQKSNTRDSPAKPVHTALSATNSPKQSQLTPGP